MPRVDVVVDSAPRVANAGNGETSRISGQFIFLPGPLVVGFGKKPRVQEYEMQISAWRLDRARGFGGRHPPTVRHATSISPAASLYPSPLSGIT
jgi:hypothetical protein